MKDEKLSPSVKSYIDGVIKMIICSVYIETPTRLDGINEGTFEERSNADKLIERINQVIELKYKVSIDNEYLYDFLTGQNAHVFSFVAKNNIIQRAWLSKEGDAIIREFYMRKLKETCFSTWKRWLNILDHIIILNPQEYIDDYAGFGKGLIF